MFIVIYMLTRETEIYLDQLTPFLKNTNWSNISEIYGKWYSFTIYDMICAIGTICTILKTLKTPMEECYFSSRGVFNVF